MRRPLTLSEEYEEDWWKDWNDELNYKRSGSKNNSFREIEKFWREMERLTRPKYKNKKKKKDSSSSGSRINHRFSKLQNCTVKCSYEKNSFRKHIDFLKLYLPQENKTEVKEKPVLFSEVEDVVSDKTLAEYVSNADKSFWRFILSPERQDIPLHILVRKFMKTVEEKTGYKLSWFAAEHHDTANQHVHILINGIDKNNKTVSFDKSFFKKSLFKIISQEICTSIVGYRTIEEIENSEKKLITAKRWTTIDTNIKLSETVLSYDKNDIYTSSVTARNPEMQARLLFLTELGFAKKIGKGEYPGQFLLENNWDNKLRAIGNYNSFFTARNNLHKTKKKNLELYSPSSGMIEGRVTKLYRHDFEGSWCNALVIESEKENKAWFIPLRKEPNEKLLNCKVSFSSHYNGKQIINNNLRIVEWGKKYGK